MISTSLFCGAGKNVCMYIYMYIYIYIHRNECPWSGFVNIYIHEYYMFMCVYMGQIQYVHVWKPHPAKDEFLLHHEQNCGITRLTSTTVINHLHPLGWILQVSLFQTPRQAKAKMPCNHLGLRHKNTKVKGATVYQWVIPSYHVDSDLKVPRGTFRGHHIIWAHMTPGPKLHAPDFLKKKIPQKSTTQS